MLKKVVNYEDFDGNQRSETLYFNLTRTELVEMAMDLPENMSETIGNDPEKIDEAATLKLLETMGSKGIMDYIKNLLLKSYGIKSEDGRRFEKSEEISKEFSQTLAFDAIFMELMSDEKAASDFISNIIPASMAEKMPATPNISALPMN